MENQPPMDAPTGRNFPGLRCSATARQTGERCGNPAIHGGTVCRFHGGGTPSVKARANLRLLELVDPSIARLARVVATGKDDDAIRAANSILDRAGIVRRTDIDPAAATALLIERLRELAEERAHPIVEGSIDDGD